MVVPHDYWTENILKIQEESYKYALLRTEHLERADMEEQFFYNLQVLNMLSTLTYSNKMFQSMGSKKRFNMNILFDVQKAVLNDEPLSLKKAEVYFKLMAEFEVFVNEAKKLSPDIADIYIDTDVEMLLLGFTFKKQALIKSDKERGKLGDLFFKLKYECIEGKISFKDFYEEASETFEDYLPADLGKAS